MLVAWTPVSRLFKKINVNQPKTNTDEGNNSKFILILKLPTVNYNLLA